MFQVFYSVFLGVFYLNYLVYGVFFIFFSVYSVFISFIVSFIFEQKNKWTYKCPPML